jgi:hypothetical protein
LIAEADAGFDLEAVRTMLEKHHVVDVEEQVRE